MDKKDTVLIYNGIFSSGQFSHSVKSNSLRPHELQHARPPCPSPTPRIDSNTCPLSQWCHPTVSSSVIPFSSCLQSFPASGSFQIRQFFTSGGQSIGAWAPASFIGRPMNIQSWFPLGLTSLVSLLSKGLSRVFASTTVQKYQFFGAQLSFSSVQSLSHVWLFATPGTVARQASLSITNSQSLLKLMSFEPVMPSNHLILCCPLLLLPSVFPSIRVFYNESSSHQVAKVLELQSQHQSFHCIFRTDFL